MCGVSGSGGVSWCKVISLCGIGGFTWWCGRCTFKEVGNGFYGIAFAGLQFSRDFSLDFSGDFSLNFSGTFLDLVGGNRMD